MKVGLVGLPQSGKTTVFEALTSKIEETRRAPHEAFSISEIAVPDERLDLLDKCFNPKKLTPTKITFVDMQFDIQQVENGIDPKHLKDVDELSFIIRSFQDDTIPHPLTNIDPSRDIEVLNTGILLSDIDLIQKRIDKIDQEAKKGIKDSEKELLLLNKLLKGLEEGFPIRKMQLSSEEDKVISGYKFLSYKPFLIALNAGEDDLGESKISSQLSKWASKQNLDIIEFCAKLEKEIMQINEDERPQFMQELGIRESALDKFIHTSYKILDLISFFTVKGDETRAWSIKSTTSAWEAAGKIHSDIQRGFIKAEIIGFDDFKTCDYSFKVAKEKGLLKLEGKDYIIKDGDIVNFRFNI